MIVGTREQLGRNPHYDKICLPLGGHIWITASPFGEDRFCVRCWHDTSIVGYFMHGDPVAEDARALVIKGWIYVPKEPTLGHGMTPCWSHSKESWLEEIWDEVMPMQEFMTMKGL